MSWFIELYWTSGIFLIFGTLVAHYSIVLPFLQGRGQIGVGSWLFNIWQGKNLETYGEICLREGRSLFWYSALKLAYKLMFGWVFGWIVLMFILIISE